MRSSEERGMSCFLFVAHAQGPAMPQLDMAPTGEPEAPWGALAIAKGVGVAIVPNSTLPEALHGHSGRSSGETLDISERDVRAIHIRCEFGATPVCFAPGAAYIVCVRGASRCREFSAALGAPPTAQSSVLILDLDRGDCIHPVQVATQHSAASGTAGLDTGLRDVSALMPLVRLRGARRLVEPPPVLSVSDLAGSAADSPGTERIVSVCGTILQREVTKAITFSTATDVGRAVVGQLENRITLQDDCDGTQTVAVYVKLSSFSHPLGLVPGARVVFHDVMVSTSRSTGNLYLVGTAATSVDEATAPAPTPSARPEHRPAAAGDPAHVCIAQLYPGP
ncbi:hypothetical protein H4R19_006346, partial [Coemansia spiralis]